MGCQLGLCVGKGIPVNQASQALSVRNGTQPSWARVVLRWLVDSLSQECKINAKMSISGKGRKLSPEIEVTVFCIVQEALNNIKQHSEATNDIVVLTYAPKSLKITVQDNRKRFSLSQILSNRTTEGHLGLIGMEQRARDLNSTLNINSHPGKGTIAYVEIGNQVLAKDGNRMSYNDATQSTRLVKWYDLP